MSINQLKLSAGDILRLIQCRTVFYENAIDRLFRMILHKQPFRKSSLENLFNFTNLTNKAKYVMRGFKYIFILVFFAAWIYIMFFQTETRRTEIGYASFVSGRVTGINRARGYKIYLNDSKIAYNFDNFSNDKISKDNWLGYYLEFKDSIYKKQNSDSLCLIRNGNLTYWTLSKTN